MVGKYFLGGAHSISQVLTRRQLTAHTYLFSRHAKTYATKEFFVFRIARESDIYIGRRYVM